MQGNNYDIVITDAMVRQWGSHSASGTNYKLVGTLRKQAIDIVAQITGWTEIVSTGNEGQIKFLSYESMPFTSKVIKKLEMYCADANDDTVSKNLYSSDYIAIIHI